jgi:hypothetical protein
MSCVHKALTHSAGWQPPIGGILKSIGDGGTYGSLAVRFSGPDEPDLQGEWFDSETDFGARGGEGHVPTLFNHGVPVAQGGIFKKFADSVFPDATIKRVPEGLFGTIKLLPDDPLQSALARLIELGALRFSSGSTIQFARRDGGRILRWPIAELSVTPTPRRTASAENSARLGAMAYTHDSKAIFGLRASGPKFKSMSVDAMDLESFISTVETMALDYERRYMFSHGPGWRNGSVMQ